MTNGLEFDIALSFAGEDRSWAEKLATLLKAQGVPGLLRRILSGKSLGQEFVSTPSADIQRESQILHCIRFGGIRSEELDKA